MSNLATITNNILADSGIDDINVIVSTGSYANPAWITSLAWTKITGAPLGDYLPLVGGTMTGNINWAQTDRGLTWLFNTDGASIKFYNTGDGDTNSRLEFATLDNNNEYFRWVHIPDGGTTYESMRLVPNSSGNAQLIVSGSIIKQGGTSSQYLMADGSVSTLTNAVTGTGTTNYLPKFTGSTTIGNSIIQDAGTRIDVAGVLRLTPSSTTDIQAYTGSAYSNLFYDAASHNWQTSGGTAKMTLTASGNLLIGTISDNGARLQVSGTSTFSNIITANSDIHQVSTGGLYWGAPSTYVIGVTGNTANGNLSFITGSTVKLTIASTGAATFSSSVTAAQFLASSSSNAAIITSTGTTGYGLVAVGSAGGARDIFLAGQSGFSNGFTVQYTGTEMRYTFLNGNVGIGTASPSFQLHVNRAGNTGIFLSNTTGNAAGYLYAGGLDGLEIQSVDSSNSTAKKLMLEPYGGNVLIGTTTDNGARLQVSGSVNINGEGTHIGIDATGGVGRVGFVKQSGLQPFMAFAADPLLIRVSNSSTIAATNTFSTVLSLTTTGVATFSNLAGSGNRIVVANSGGTLISAVIGSGLAFDGTTLTATGGGSGSISGSGTSGTVALFTGATSIGNSVITQSGSTIGITSGITDSAVTFTNSTAYSTSNNYSLTYRSTTASFGIQPIANIIFDTVGDAASRIRFVTRDNASDYDTRMVITSTGTIGFNGNSGVGDAALGKMSMGYLNSNYGWIQTWSGTRLLLNPSGNPVIIGSTSNNGERFQVTGNATFTGSINPTKSAKNTYGIQIRGAFYGAPRLQLYDLAVDPNAHVGLGIDMSGAPYEFSNYFPRTGGNGRWSVGSWAGDFGAGQYVSGYNEKLFITESAAQFNTNLGIGVSPATNLHVQGASVSYGQVRFLNSSSSGEASIHIGRTNQTVEQRWTVGQGVAGIGDSFGFYTGGSSRVNLQTNGNLLIGTTSDNGNRLRVNGTIFSDSSVTATSFFESSDATLKTLVEDNYQAKGIESVVAKLYIKNGKQELGYFAQDLQDVLPSAVSKGSDGLLNLSYREVHTAKIAYLEERIKQLEKKYENN